MNNFLENNLITKKCVVIRNIQKLDKIQFFNYDESKQLNTNLEFKFNFTLNTSEFDYDNTIILHMSKFLKINIQKSKKSEKKFYILLRPFCVCGKKVKKSGYTFKHPYIYSERNDINVKLKYKITNDKMTYKMFINDTDYLVNLSLNKEIRLNDDPVIKFFSVPHNNAIMTKYINCTKFEIINKLERASNTFNEIIKIIVENNDVYVHKSILTKYDFFCKLISDEFGDYKNKEIQLEEINLDNFNLITNYMYTNKINILCNKELDEILYWADRYCMMDLIKILNTMKNIIKN